MRQVHKTGEFSGSKPGGGGCNNRPERLPVHVLRRDTMAQDDGLLNGGHDAGVIRCPVSKAVVSRVNYICRIVVD